MAKNPYIVLGVTETATDEEIRTAYRRLAKKYHPDLNPNNAEAARRMNEVNVAYDQIKTAEKRAAYRSSQTQQTYYQQSYTNNPFETYYRTGQGYYGGSYTGNNRSDNNEPPFGWSSVFEEQQRRRTYTPRFRLLRFVYLALAFLLLTMMARCALYSCLIGPMQGCLYGFAENGSARSSDVTNADQADYVAE